MSTNGITRLATILSVVIGVAAFRFVCGALGLGIGYSSSYSTPSYSSSYSTTPPPGYVSEAYYSYYDTYTSRSIDKYADVTGLTEEETEMLLERLLGLAADDLLIVAGKPETCGEEVCGVAPIEAVRFLSDVALKVRDERRAERAASESTTWAVWAVVVAGLAVLANAILNGLKIGLDERWRRKGFE